MKIFIPSYRRPNAVKTLESIPDGWLKHTFIVCDQDEHLDYELANPEANVLSIPEDIKGIAAKRQWIVSATRERYIMMLDDDMTFAHRPDMRSPKLVASDKTQVGRMLNSINTMVGIDAPAIGVSARQGNHNSAVAAVECTRMMNAYAFDTKVLKEHNIRFDDVVIMEDFHVTLSLFKHGYKNIVLYNHCWNQKGSGAAGGCSEWRTAEVQKEGAERLAELHPGYVKVVEKDSKSLWKNMKHRYDVRVQWRKCYDDHQI